MSFFGPHTTEILPSLTLRPLSSCFNGPDHMDSVVVTWATLHLGGITRTCTFICTISVHSPNLAALQRFAFRYTVFDAIRSTSCSPFDRNEVRHPDIAASDQTSWGDILWKTVYRNANTSNEPTLAPQILHSLQSQDS